MDLSLTQEQEALQQSVRSLLENRFPTTTARNCEVDPSQARPIYAALGELGLGGILVPECAGGLALGMTEMVVVQAELGRALVPLLFAQRIVAAAPMLNSWSDAAQVACAFDGAPRLNGERLNGDGGAVVEAAEAGRLLVLAVDSEGAPLLCVVDRNAAGLVLTDLPNLADQSMQHIRFEYAPVSAIIARGSEAARLHDQARARLRIAIAAQAVGGAERILAITRDYATTRQQFGQPIGGFQAIAHMLADAAVHVAGARILVYRAAAAADEGEDFAVWADLAKMKACQTYRDASAMAIQVHGGIGFTLEADPQLFYRRAKFLQLMFGDPMTLQDNAGAALLSGKHKVLEA